MRLKNVLLPTFGLPVIATVKLIKTGWQQANAGWQLADCTF